MLFAQTALALVAVSMSLLGAEAATIPQKRATVCNGSAKLCEKSYGTVTYAGAHDSAFFSKNPLALSRDQEVDVPSQLKLGARLLQSQAHLKDDKLHFCHTSCVLFDGGLAVDYLKKVKIFLDDNRNEVLTLIFTNPERLSVADIWAPAFKDSGIADLAFVPKDLPVKRAEWPTLGEMIDSNKRVVVFLDTGADTAKVPFILPEFDMVWETPFSVTDPKFPCKVDRISGPLSPADHMYMINHSLNKNILPFGDGVLVSDPGAAKTTNSIASIEAHADVCKPLSGNNPPNFVLLDFINIGEGIKAVNKLNGLP